MLSSDDKSRYNMDWKYDNIAVYSEYKGTENRSLGDAHMVPQKLLLEFLHYFVI